MLTTKAQTRGDDEISTGKIRIPVNDIMITIPKEEK